MFAPKARSRAHGSSVAQSTGKFPLLPKLFLVCRDPKQARRKLPGTGRAYSPQISPSCKEAGRESRDELSSKHSPNCSSLYVETLTPRLRKHPSNKQLQANKHLQRRIHLWLSKLGRSLPKGCFSASSVRRFIFSCVLLPFKATVCDYLLTKINSVSVSKYKKERKKKKSSSQSISPLAAPINCSYFLYVSFV